MRRLVMFARLPRRGRVKTRLSPPLSADQALALYRSFLEDGIRLLRCVADRFDVELCVDANWTGDPTLDAGAADLARRLQGAGDLGQRIWRAMARADAEGASATVVIGSDAPTLPPEIVEQAFGALEHDAPVAVAPAQDGGYVLLGVRRPHAELLRDVPWGGPRVLEVTLSRAAACGLSVARLPAWYDVDDIAALRRLRQDLARPELAARAPSTIRAITALPQEVWTAP